MKERLGPAANERDQAEMRRKEKLQAFQKDEDLKWLLQQPQFRRWAAGLIFDKCLVNKKIWDPSAKIHLFEGMRTVGIDTLMTFMKFPELYSQFEQDRVQAEGELLSRLNRKVDEDGAGE